MPDFIDFWCFSAYLPLRCFYAICQALKVHNFFLKKLEWIIVPILTKLIDKCIDERSFPPCLKEAIIVAVHKSGDVQEPSNFRPISLLPTVAKFFETFLYNKISNFLEVYDLLDANQYGFRRQRETLKKSNEVKYLGVLLDNKLDFKKHINSVAAKLTKFTGLFYKLRFILSIKQLVLVYKSFVQPVIQYGVLIYGTASKTSLKFIEVKIKQISWIIFKKQSHQSTANERAKYGIFLVKELHIYELLKFLTKTIRREHKNEVFNRFIEDSELVRLDEKRTTSKKLKPSNQFTGINPKRIGIRIRKLLNYILYFDSKYVHFTKSCYKSGINTHHHTFLKKFYARKWYHTTFLLVFFWAIV